LPKVFTAVIESQQSFNIHFRLLSLSNSEDLELPQPGQFYMLQVSPSFDPLLKRPLSLFMANGRTLQFLYRIRGRGTLLLSKKKEGEEIALIGPLGTGYRPPEGDFVAVAGGIGIASLFPLVKSNRGRAHLFYGGRDACELVMLEELRTVARKVDVTTDDGSVGMKGLVTEALRSYLAESRVSGDTMPVYACGPSGMLRTVAEICLSRDITCYVSLEERMACGVGACVGCVAMTTGGYRRVCVDGPVFDAREIVWQASQ
jgi:dihydroorotate dehydrogenase electron transfer subunit